MLQLLHMNRSGSMAECVIKTIILHTDLTLDMFVEM